MPPASEDNTTTRGEWLCQTDGLQTPPEKLPTAHDYTVPNPLVAQVPDSGG